MVLSTTKKTASVDSIINSNQGGGPKKAGLPYQVGRDYHFPIALAVHPSRNTLADYGNPVVFGLRHERRGYQHKALKPIGSTYTPNTYFSMRK
jgi:hypothetical protein|tara:strand:- start:17915 stop:18193 length:279 start_codon:yes stop_codon:yes gene_type:complete